MSNQKSKPSALIQTRNLEELADKTGNLYESISIIGKRANQMKVNTTEVLREKLNEFSSSSDNLEEVHENLEQIEISKYYEKLAKAPIMALQEFIDGDTYYRYIESEETTPEKKDA